jgi:hypothetical protein
MHISKSKQIRPNINVKFWSAKEHSSSEFLLYFKKRYLDTKKLVNSKIELSEDQLTLTAVTEWSSEKDYMEFSNDRRVLEEIIIPRIEYAEKNNIKIIYVEADQNMILVQGPDPYPNLVIPETWQNVEEFADWWLKAGMPMRFPPNPEVFLSDDATSIALFRKGRFQVELYLIHPCPKVPLHGHPDVEVIKIRMGERRYVSLSETLRNGGTHGAGIRLEAEDRGYPLIAIQHWLTRDPTTIASMWKGETVGTKQENLIKRFNPDAYVVQGYADITKSM